MESDERVHLTDYSDDEINRLIESVYNFIKEKEITNVYYLSQQYNSINHSVLIDILDLLREKHSIGYCPTGIEVTGDLLLLCNHNTDAEHDTCNDSLTLDDNSSDKDYIFKLEQVGAKLDDFSRNPFLNYKEDGINKSIISMPDSLKKDVLINYFLKSDYSIESYEDSRADSIIQNYCNNFKCDPIDIDLYTKYDLSPNFLQYILRLTPEYIRVLAYTYEPGRLSHQCLLTELESVYSSGNYSNPYYGIYERFTDILYMYTKKNNDASNYMSFIEVYLFIFNFYVISEDELLKVYYNLFLLHDDLEYDLQITENINCEHYLTGAHSYKYLEIFVINQIVNLFENMPEYGFSVTPEKLFKKHQNDLYPYLDGALELQQFIEKYTSYKMEYGYIVFGESLRESLIRFILKKKKYNLENVSRDYCKQYGGNKAIINSILETIKPEEIFIDKKLPENVKNKLKQEFKEYEWVTRSNAKSIFSDKNSFAEYFSEASMYELGFYSNMDIFYRIKYPDYLTCLRKNEFSGNDLSVDNLFRIKMESVAFSEKVNYFITNLMWIPVSENRFINLRSERFSYLRQAFCDYIHIVEEMCANQFMTPFLLRNIRVGIDEIDNDDYDLIFYDAILKAAKVHHSKINGFPFYYNGNLEDEFEFHCTTTDFLRYLVLKNGGQCSIDELREILYNEYGINTEMQYVRQIVNQSECIFSKDTDVAYFDINEFEEALENEIVN